MFKRIRILIVILCLSFFTGCATKYLSARPPVIEDKVGKVLGTLATAPDYRVVYVRYWKNENDTRDVKICAEAPADAGAQFSQTFASALTAQGEGAPLTAEARTGLAVAMKQLFIRSQGVQFYRDGSFALCNLYLNGNGRVTEQEYLGELKALRSDAKELIDKEIQYLHKMKADEAKVPVAPETANQVSVNSCYTAY